MSHRVVAEHRHLEELFETTARALAAATGTKPVWPAFEQLSGELDTHFEQEDQLYFPAISGLRPELKPQLDELGLRHRWFRDQLRRIGDHLGHDDLEGAARVFRDLHQAFLAHERIEEAILLRLDAEIGA